MATSRYVLRPSNIIPGYFTEGNVTAISIIVNNILTKEFSHPIVIPREYVESTMGSVYEEGTTMPSFYNVHGQNIRGRDYLNNKVISRLLSSARTEILNTQRANMWSKQQKDALRYDSSLGIRQHDILKLRPMEKTMPLVWSRTF